MSRLQSCDFLGERRGFAAFRVLASITAISVTVLFSTAAAQTTTRGLWHLGYETEQDRVQLNFKEYSHGRGGMAGFGVSPSQLSGITRSQLTSAEGPVRFQLVRDAGTFNFEGQIYRGQGNGSFTFVADPRFSGELSRRGYARPTAEQQFHLALHDVGYSLLDELRNQGYNRPSINDLVTMGMHGVGFDYVRRLGALGYRVGSTDRLVRMQDHGVSPAFITALAAAGYSKLSVDRLVELRDHGVTPEFIARMAEAGYSGLSAEELVQLQDHGVTPAYIAGLAKAGYKGLSTDQLLNARDHGVTPDFAEGFRRLGYSRMSLRQLVQLRDQGVSVAFAERVRDREGAVSVEELIRIRVSGDRY